MIHILSTSLASVSIFLSVVTLGIYLGARDVRIFEREKSLGQNNIGTIKATDETSAQPQVKVSLLLSISLTKSLYVHVSIEHEWSLYLGHLCVNTCSSHTLKKEEFTVSTVCENVSVYVTKLPHKREECFPPFT
jgi:hypothetical protein